MRDRFPLLTLLVVVCEGKGAALPIGPYRPFPPLAPTHILPPYGFPSFSCSNTIPFSRSHSSFHFSLILLCYSQSYYFPSNSLAFLLLFHSTHYSPNYVPSLPLMLLKLRHLLHPIPPLTLTLLFLPSLYSGFPLITVPCYSPSQLPHPVPSPSSSSSPLSHLYLPLP